MMLALPKYLLMLFLVLPTTIWGRLVDPEEQEETFSTNPQEERETSTFTSNQTPGETTAPFRLLTPTYFGSGCPKGTVKVVPAAFDSDVTTVSVLFSDYIAETYDTTTRVRKSCNMALPVDVAPGLSVGIFKIDYRGSTYVPQSLSVRKPYARFDAEYFFAGQRGPLKSRTYSGSSVRAMELSLFESDTVGAIAWSDCGGQTNFRINTSIIASKLKPSDEDVFITLDSKEIHQDGFYFAFQSRKC